MALVRKLLTKYSPDVCEIFSVHNLGKAKYETLGKEYDDFPVIPDHELQIAADFLKESGVKIRIIRL